VFSYPKRDRQSLFPEVRIPSNPASSAAHVSLSSHLQLSNNRQTQKPSQNQRPKLPPRATNQHSANPLDFFRTKVFVASSAAALVQ